MGSSATPSTAASAPGRRKVALYLALLTLQYGAQPLISKRFVRQEVIVTTLVLSIEVAKVICAVILLVAEGSLKKQFNNWSITRSLTASGLPAAIYALQNSLLQISYKNLDSLTFSILNQTKLLFTAFFTYLILGYVLVIPPIYILQCIDDAHDLMKQKQSPKQIFALTLLIAAAVLLSIGESSSKGSGGGNSDYILLYGIIPVTVASVLSGLASSLCQWASQVKKHTSYMMTIEMSFIGSMCLLASTSQSPDGEAIRKHGFFHEWTLLTVVPVLMNAVGGILVGLVTTYAGGGFVIVSALLVTALLQFIFDGKPPSLYCLIALPLVMTSIFIYQKYPYAIRLFLPSWYCYYFLNPLPYQAIRLFLPSWHCYYFLNPLPYQAIRLFLPSWHCYYFLNPLPCQVCTTELSLTEISVMTIPPRLQ
uniref:CMP-sialic acid transporter 5 n=1 Tax=Oryza nivara TaxID=4536 RepID=A0A0E0G8M5_ORYNI